MAKVRRPRVCDTCGNSYARRNLVEVWDVRNPGSRLGWHKTIVKQCLLCSSTTQTRRMLMVVQVDVSRRQAAKQANG